MIYKPEHFAGIEVLDHDISRPLYPEELKAIAQVANAVLGEPKRVYSTGGNIWSTVNSITARLNGYVVMENIEKKDPESIPRGNGPAPI